jgi:hypothetical protein
MLGPLPAVEWSAAIPLLRCYLLLFGCPMLVIKLQVPLGLMTMELEVGVEVLQQVQLGLLQQGLTKQLTMIFLI